MTAKAEVWRDIPGWPYAVSDRGRVMRTDTGRFRNPGNTKRYTKLTLWSDGAPWQVNVHTLVTMMFIGPRPDGLEVNHRNGDKADNRIENLEYVTPSENRLHATRVLGKGIRETHGLAKANSEVAKVIRHMRGRRSQRLLGRIFGINQSHVSKIMRGERWGEQS